MSRKQRFLILGLVIIAVIGWTRDLRYTVHPGFDYWLIDPQLVGVLIVGGPNDACSIGETTENQSEVRIAAECRRPFSLGGTAVGVPYIFEVPLAEPLGTRVVLDGYGNPANPCAYPLCRPPIP